MKNKYQKSQDEIRNGLSDLYNKLTPFLAKNPSLFIERRLDSLKFGRQTYEPDEVSYEIFSVQKTRDKKYNIEYTGLEKTAKLTFSNPIIDKKSSALLKKIKEKVGKNLKQGKKEKEFEILVSVEESTNSFEELKCAFDYISKSLNEK